MCLSTESTGVFRMTKNFSLVLTGIPLFQPDLRYSKYRHKLWGGIARLSQPDRYDLLKPEV